MPLPYKHRACLSDCPMLWTWCWQGWQFPWLSLVNKWTQSRPNNWTWLLHYQSTKRKINHGMKKRFWGIWNSSPIFWLIMYSLRKSPKNFRRFVLFLPSCLFFSTFIFDIPKKFNRQNLIGRHDTIANFVCSGNAQESCHGFCVNTHQYLQDGKQNNLNNRYERAREQFSNTHSTKSQFNVNRKK